MFKRVEKRRRKQEEEEELGLDGEMKDVLGMNDTDSEESDSDSDDSESETEGKEANAEEEAEGEGDEDDEDSSEESDSAEEPPISVEEAIRDPVYIVSLQPDVKACIVCPGKLLKSAEVLVLHRASKAHERRWRQFIAFAKSSDAEPSANAWDVLKLRAEEQPKLSLTPSTVSKRNAKREQQKAKIAARRAKKWEAKLKAKAKKAAASGVKGGEEDSSPSAPSKKKRKVDEAPAVQGSVPDSTVTTEPSGKLPKASRSPRRDRLERQGKLLAKLAPHAPPGGRGKGNGKKKGSGKFQDERGKRSKKDGKSNEKSKPLQIFD
ncbi:hypothetical protein DFH07DRAFT_939652 [Mycena maculata]|uniref:Uncharacterized protein n=1 Tax=Mycena maculata TaxID=230809 RepID=A0AAD7JEK7_9AGAR|nr:hypothetical protein DFH07DRAFT_939652 [Mycena maculata]